MAHTMTWPKSKVRVQMEMINNSNSLKSEFAKTFRPGSRARLWLISSINRNIRSYNLVGVDVWDILTEAYIRAGRFIANNGCIWNLVSWLKTASGFIIKEHKRKFGRSDTVSVPDGDWLSTFSMNQETDPEDIDILSSALDKALEKLTPLERNCLSWRVSHQWSWEIIHKHLITQGTAPPSINNLRKKKQRAIRKLNRSLNFYRFRVNSLSDMEFELLSESFRKILRDKQA